MTTDYLLMLLGRHGLLHITSSDDEWATGPLLDVAVECDAAQLVHGDLPVSAHKRLGILLEEVGEAAQATNKHTWEAPCAPAVRAELVQVAATALRMIVAHDSLTITPSRHARPQ